MRELSYVLPEALLFSEFDKQISAMVAIGYVFTKSFLQKVSTEYLCATKVNFKCKDDHYLYKLIKNLPGNCEPNLSYVKDKFFLFTTDMTAISLPIRLKKAQATESRKETAQEKQILPLLFLGTCLDGK